MTNSPPSSCFDAVLFDMDGLLLDTERLVNESLVKTAEQFGMSDLESTFLEMIGFRGAESESILRNGLAGRVGLEDFCIAAEREIASCMQTGVPLKTGVVKLLEALQQQQLPCAVASSTDTDRIEAHLADAGIRSFFSAIVGGDQVAEGKPDPEIYLKAAAAVGIAPSRCVAFEDSEPGTLAALAAGATVVQIPDLVQPSATLRANGHIIADDIWIGALQVGLCS